MPFLSLIITLCKQARVPRNKKTNVEVNLLASTSILISKAEFLRDEEDRVRKKSIDKMLVVDIKARNSDIARLNPKVGITFSSPTVYLFPFFNPTGESHEEEHAKYDQPFSLGLLFMPLAD